MVMEVFKSLSRLDDSDVSMVVLKVVGGYYCLVGLLGGMKKESRVKVLDQRVKSPRPLGVRNT